MVYMAAAISVSFPLAAYRRSSVAAVHEARMYQARMCEPLLTIVAITDCAISIGLLSVLGTLGPHKADR